MSLSVIKLVRGHAVGSPTRKAVLMHMAYYASDDGSGIWTSKSMMAEELEMGRRTVQVCIDSLIAAGLIEAVGKRAMRNGYTDEYNIIISAVNSLPKVGVTPPASRAKVSDPTCAGAAHVQELHMTCAGAAHHGVQELHINCPSIVREQSEKQYAGERPDGDGAKPKVKRASQIPKDWALSQKNIDHAISKGLSNQEIENEAERFANYHQSRGTTFKDWDAGWRTWVGNAVKFARGRNAAGSTNASRDRKPSGIFGAVTELRAARGH